MAKFQFSPEHVGKSILSPFLDDELPDNVAIYLVREVLDEKYGYLQGGAVQARAKFGWRVDPGTWLRRRKEYGDVGDHTLLSDEEAAAHLEKMGLSLQDGKALLIQNLTEINGTAPDMLDTDPNLDARRAAARSDAD